MWHCGRSPLAHLLAVCSAMLITKRGASLGIVTPRLITVPGNEPCAAQAPAVTVPVSVSTAMNAEIRSIEKPPKRRAAMRHEERLVCLSSLDGMPTAGADAVY